VYPALYLEALWWLFFLSFGLHFGATGGVTVSVVGKTLLGVFASLGIWLALRYRVSLLKEGAA
jgi:hypothetical protein